MVRARAPRTPRKQSKKQGRKPIPPTIRFSREEMEKQPQPQKPPPQPPAVRVVPWPRPPARRRLTVRSLPPQPASRAKPVQVAEVTSEFMENDVEVVEELSQLPPPQTGAITKPGDVTSTTNDKLGSLPILDLTEEFIRINNVCEEAAQAVNEYVAKMNDVGVFLEPLGVAPTEL